MSVIDFATYPSDIERAWEIRDSIGELSESERQELVALVDAVLDLLDAGEVRVAEPGEDGEWVVNQWLKMAVLLSFRLNDNRVMGIDPDFPWFDKVDSKFKGWDEAMFRQEGFRAVPPCAVRRGSFIGSNVVLMPSYVNIGAFVDDGCMVDTWATVGSCAQIGKRVHISGGAGIGGVLEPLQANPVIIEDDAFIGARCEVVEGVIVRSGAVLAPLCAIGQSTPIFDRTQGKQLSRGEIPANAVVVPGGIPHFTDGEFTHTTYCVVIIKYADLQTRAKVGLNALLRD